MAHILAELRLDAATLCAALLHDVVEDAQISLSAIAAEFGPDTARLVEGVTKISRLDLVSPEVRQVESVRKMLLAMVTDVRVVLIKLADRLHNMRTLSFLLPEKQERIARETLDIYAPVAHRLGMGAMRGDLEDLAFSYLEPSLRMPSCRAWFSQRSRKSSKNSWPRFRKRLASIWPRIMSPRLWRAGSSGFTRFTKKCSVKKERWNRFHDLLAVRIITDSVRNCYGALGVVHQILAAGAGAVQRLHCHAAPEPLSVLAAYDGNPRRPALRSADPHASDAPYRGARRRRTLEI